MAQPDGKKIFFENLSGAGKAIAVLTSGGDAQGKLPGYTSYRYALLYVCEEARRGRKYTSSTLYGRTTL